MWHSASQCNFFFHLFLQCLQSQKTNNFRTTRHPYRSSIPTPDIYSLNKNLGGSGQGLTAEDQGQKSQVISLRAIEHHLPPAELRGQRLSGLPRQVCPRSPGQGRRSQRRARLQTRLQEGGSLLLIKEREIEGKEDESDPHLQMAHKDRFRVIVTSAVNG